jgi:hypothetical protein
MKLLAGLLFLLLICTSQVYADLVKGTRSNGKKARSLSGSSRHLGSSKGGKGGGKQAGKCGCSGCTDAVWERDAGDFKCGARIEFLQVAFANTYPTEEDACRRVAGIEFPDICGPCDPASCVKAVKNAKVKDTTYCGCPECTNDILCRDAEDYSCVARVTWLLENESTTYPDEADACHQVALEFPNACGPVCDPDACNPLPGPTRCGCPSGNEDALGVLADGYSCEARIDYLMEDTVTFPTEADACRQVASEFPNACGPACDPNTCN